jgi:predicted component of type VI protein secretion system
LHKLQSEIAECDYIVSGGRAEIMQQLQNWSIESYYRALQLQVEKAEAQARALEKTKK